jgi:hypothetical protein
MSDSLNIALDVAHPATIRAAVELAYAWRDAGGGVVRPLVPGLSTPGPTVRLSLGSLVRPSVVVRFDVAYREAAAAEQLALSIAAWDSLDGLEGWRAMSAPLDNVPHVGRPHWSEPWAITASGSHNRTHDGHQLHVLGGWRPPDRGNVWWPGLPGVVAAVLGRAAYVLGSAGPLAYDAARAGVDVRPDSPSQPSGAALRFENAALAGLVPPSLLGEPTLWQHVAETARAVHDSGEAPLPLMTPAWVATGRDRIREHRAAAPSSWERLRRRQDKFRRDPERFFADSRFKALRAAGKLFFARR